jgi:hypothetical protein
MELKEMKAELETKISGFESQYAKLKEDYAKVCEREKDFYLSEVKKVKEEEKKIKRVLKTL